MFCADPLHQIEHGVWGKHLWVWFKGYYLLRGELDKLDDRSVCFTAQLLRVPNGQLPSSFMAIPPISKLHHFPNGICRLKYITGREQGIVLRVSYSHDQGAPLDFLNWRFSTFPHLRLESAPRHETKTRSSFQPSGISPAFSSFPSSTPTPPQPYPF